MTHVLGGRGTGDVGESLASIDVQKHLSTRQKTQYERHGHTGKSPAQGHKGDEETGISLMKKGAFYSGEDKAKGISHQCM